LPWWAVPGATHADDRSYERGEIRALKILTVLAGDIAIPDATQAREARRRNRRPEEP
jgi:hypothetical protein